MFTSFRFIDPSDQCSSNGFKCTDPVEALDDDQDVCADLGEEGLFEFKGVTFTVCVARVLGKTRGHELVIKRKMPYSCRPAPVQEGNKMMNC